MNARPVKIGAWIWVYGISMGVYGQLPPEKGSVERRYEEMREAGLKNPAPKDGTAQRAPKVQSHPFPAGIMEDTHAPFPSEYVRINNRWQNIVDGKPVWVYAGTEVQENGDLMGAIIVVASQASMRFRPGTYLAPAGTTSLRLVGESQNRLLLSSNSGKQFVFNPDSTNPIQPGDVTLPTLRIAASPATLWPPNDKLVPISITET